MLVLVALAAHASTFDHTHALFDDFLEGAVQTAGVDYAALKTRHDVLDRYLAALATAPVATFTNDEKLAFWVNAYNAHTLDLMLDEGVPASIRDLDGGQPWTKRTFTVGGEVVTLDQMEHTYARSLADGRVHAVVNCASKGCPPLPPDPLTPVDIEAQLNAAAARWVATNAYRIDGEVLYLSQIFDWFGEDFASKGDLPGLDGEHEAAAWFLLDHVDADTAARLKSGTLKPAWQEYDWANNAL